MGRTAASCGRKAQVVGAETGARAQRAARTPRRRAATRAPTRGPPPPRRRGRAGGARYDRRRGHDRNARAASSEGSAVRIPAHETAGRCEGDARDRARSIHAEERRGRVGGSPRGAQPTRRNVPQSTPGSTPRRGRPHPRHAPSCRAGEVIADRRVEPRTSRARNEARPQARAFARAEASYSAFDAPDPLLDPAGGGGGAERGRAAPRVGAVAVRAGPPTPPQYRPSVCPQVAFESADGDDETVGRITAQGPWPSETRAGPRTSSR